MRQAPLRLAGSLSRPQATFGTRLQPLPYPHEPLVSYPINRQPSDLPARGGRGSCNGWTSNSETIEIAIALDIHGQVRVVVRPFLVIRELDLSHGIGEALMLPGRLF